MVFPDHADLINQLRADHPGFDEICRDFELMDQDLRRLEGDPSAQTPGALADIQSTLDGLRDEILAALGRHATESARQPTPRQ